MSETGSGSSGRIADLHAALGIKPDKKSINQAHRVLVDFGKKAERDSRGVGKRIGAALFGGIKGAGNKIKGGAANLLGGMGGGIKRAAGGLVGGLGGALGFGALGGVAALGAGIGFAAKDALSFEEALTDLDIASKGAMGTMEEMREKVLAVSGATGVAKEELLSGAASFIALTGDGKAAAASLELFGKVAKATKTDMADISGVAASMIQNLGLKPEEFEKAFSIVIAGGKAGAVEMKEMAGELAALAASSKAFKGGTGIQGISELSAALQIARQDFGSTSEAATGMERLMSTLISPGTVKALQKVGVKVFDTVGTGKNKKKVRRNLMEIVEDIGNSKLMNDPTALQTALGSNQMAAKALGALTKVKGAWKDLSKQTLGANDVADDYARRQESQAEKVSRAWNDLKNQVTGVFDPEMIEAFAGMLTRVLDIAKGILDAFLELEDFIDPTGSIMNRRRKREEAKKLKADQAASASRLAGRKTVESLAAGPLFGMGGNMFGERDTRDTLNRVFDKVFPGAAGAKDYVPPAGTAPNVTIGDTKIEVHGVKIQDDADLVNQLDKRWGENWNARMRDMAAATGAQ